MIPRDESTRFVAKMEDVLFICKRPYDPDRPVVCMDEMPHQLIKEVREPIPAATGGRPSRTITKSAIEWSSLFAFFEPLASWRTVMTRRRRTSDDWAYCIGQLLTEDYPNAEKAVSAKKIEQIILPSHFITYVHLGVI